MKMKRMKRCVAAMLSGVMIIGALPLQALAVDATEEHVHDASCGYVEAVEGKPCQHKHDETFTYNEETKQIECSHVHDAACGYAGGAKAHRVNIPTTKNSIIMKKQNK